MKGSKRILSLLLAVMLVITLLPAGLARADGEMFKLTVEKGKDISMSELVKISDGKKLTTAELNALATTFGLASGAVITGIAPSVDDSAITFDSNISASGTFKNAKVYVGENVDSKAYVITLTVSYKISNVAQPSATVKICLEVKDPSTADAAADLYFSIPKNTGYLNMDKLETASADVVSTADRTALLDALGIKADAVINSITISSVPSQLSCNKRNNDTLADITGISGIQVASGTANSGLYKLVLKIKYNTTNNLTLTINIFVEEDVSIIVRKMTAVELTESTVKSLFKFAGTETLSAVKFNSVNNGSGVSVYYGGIPFNGEQTLSVSSIKEFSIHAEAGADTSASVKIPIKFTGIGNKGTSIERFLYVKVTDAVASDIIIKGELGEAETLIPNSVILDAATALFGAGVTAVEFNGVTYSTSLGNFCYRVGGVTNVFVEKLSSGVAAAGGNEFFFASKNTVGSNDTVTANYTATATVDGAPVPYSGKIVINYKTETKNITLPITNLIDADHSDWKINPTFKGAAVVTLADIAAKLGTSISISDISKVVIKNTDGVEIAPVSGKFTLPADDVTNPPRYTYTAVTTNNGTYSGVLTIGVVSAASDVTSVITAIPDSTDEYHGKFSISTSALAKAIGILESKLDASKLYIWAPDRASLMNYASDVNAKLFTNNYEDLKVYECTDTTINYYYDGDQVVSGKIVLTGEDSATPEQVGISTVAINAQTKKNAETFTVNNIANAIKAKFGTAVSITSLTLSFNSNNVTIVKGDGTNVVSGTAFNVDNSSLIEFTTKNPTSDVDITYVAKTNNGNYAGTITLKKLDQKTLEPIKAVAVYNSTKSAVAEIKTSDIKVPTGVIFTSFTDVSVTFTNAATGITVANAGTSSYGYISSNAAVKSNVKTFVPGSTLYYIPGTVAGTAVVTYKGYANNAEYVGTIEIKIYNAANLSVTLGLANRDPYSFTTELVGNDKKTKYTFASELNNAVKEAFGTGAKVSYVVFDQLTTTAQAMNSRYGTLYSSKGVALSTTTGYYFEKAVDSKATLPVSGLYYVPTSESGTYSIGYTVYVEFEDHIYELGGALDISTSPDVIISGDVVYNTTGVTPVAFAAADFQTFITNKNRNYVLKSIKLDALPQSGTLKYSTYALTEDYIKNASFSVSGTSSLISGLTFTPNSYDNSYVTIPFTATYTAGTDTTLRTTDGVILIVVTKAAVTDITYSVKAGSTVTVKANDLYNVCTAATGTVLDHVYFSAASGATLYNGTTRLGTNSAVYYSTSKTPNLGNIIINPSITSGTVSIPYSVYTSGGTFLYTGTIKVKVYSETTTPQFKVCKKSAQKVIFNGTQITFEAYLIDDYNYVKLRDIAYIMNGTGSQFSVEFDSQNVSCTTGKAYTPADGDMKTGPDNSKTCKVSSFNIYVNGEYQSAYVYNIGGYNYFKLRDLGDILNFVVDWDENKGIVIVNSSDYKA